MSYFIIKIVNYLIRVSFVRKPGVSNIKYNIFQYKFKMLIILEKYIKLMEKNLIYTIIFVTLYRYISVSQIKLFKLNTRNIICIL
jgi:hypothetical protein